MVRRGKELDGWGLGGTEVCLGFDFVADQQHIGVQPTR